MPSVTTEVLDPRTGQKRLIALVLRDDRVYLEEIKNTNREDASAARLERDAEFAEAASRAFGARKAGPLPPAAEVVQGTSFPGPTSREVPHPNRRSRQDELRALVGDMTYGQMLAQLELDTPLEGRTVPGRYLLPRREYSLLALPPAAREEYVRQVERRLQNGR